MVVRATVKNDRYTYRVTWSERDMAYVGLCAEFPSLSWLANSQMAAFGGIKKVVAEVISDMKASNEPIPQPLATKRFSGEFTVRIPPDVHKELAIKAAEDNISVNRLVSAKLATQ